MEVLGAFESPKGITNYSYKSPFGLKRDLPLALFPNSDFIVTTPQIHLREDSCPMELIQYILQS